MSNEFKKYDVAVIGAGPAGLMAGYRAASRGLDVVIFEKMDTPARKLRLTGKGRCNVVNNTDIAGTTDNIRNGARFMQSSLSAFDSAAVMSFFEERGVPLVTERGNRVFPKSGRAGDIAGALIKSAGDAGCDIVNARVTDIIIDDGQAAGIELADGRRIGTKAVIVATGGLSYPLTGSTGDGYEFALKAGHNIIEPRASLVPLECGGTDCAEMQGLSLRNVKLTLKVDDKRIFEAQGELLFTHFGISGPLVLTASAHLCGAEKGSAVASIDLKPALERDVLDKRLLRDFKDNANRDFQNSLGALVPKTMIPIIVRRSGIDPNKKIHSITVKERHGLLDILKSFDVTVTRTRPIDEAVITAGGIDLKEIDPRRMLSKKISNLHFAGEVVDADAFTGGFNLAIAFASGNAAGNYVLEDGVK